MKNSDTALRVNVNPPSQKGICSAPQHTTEPWRRCKQRRRESDGGHEEAKNKDGKRVEAPLRRPDWLQVRGTSAPRNTTEPGNGMKQFCVDDGEGPLRRRAEEPAYVAASPWAHTPAYTCRPRRAPRTGRTRTKSSRCHGRGEVPTVSEKP